MSKKVNLKEVLAAVRDEVISRRNNPSTFYMALIGGKWETMDVVDLYVRKHADLILSVGFTYSLENFYYIFTAESLLGTIISHREIMLPTPDEVILNKSFVLGTEDNQLYMHYDKRSKDKVRVPKMLSNILGAFIGDNIYGKKLTAVEVTKGHCTFDVKAC